MSTAFHAISPGQYLSGSQTITSPGGTFELGSFTPGESQNYYIDICSGAAKLLDNGNFVITDASDSSVVIGQSFDHLMDTWLPGAELGYNLRTKGKRVLTSRRNLQYPAPRLMVSKFSDFL
ncbi:G-type lectin S-receptor-like serine/threonine-protein kinase At2g19130 [Malus domestica]|uniref:G-type lectin S-receptor-like serine/threonine-protein kinase At2g19130 n=1 Tax=Malus domestica TaxID=3750 RepID=UPI0039754CE5